MALTLSVNFDTPANFSYDPSKVEFVGTGTVINPYRAQLKLVANPGQTFLEEFSSSTGFTYDSTKAEFTGGVVRSKDSRPTNVVCRGDWSVIPTTNLAWGNDVLLTPTSSVGTVSVSGGFLQISGTNSSLNWDKSTETNLNCAVGEEGEVRVTVQFGTTNPNPGNFHGIINILESSVSSANKINLALNQNGAIFVTTTNNLATQSFAFATTGIIPLTDRDDLYDVIFSVSSRYLPSSALCRIVVYNITKGTLVLNESVSRSPYTVTATQRYLQLGGGTVSESKTIKIKDLVIYNTPVSLEAFSYSPLSSYIYNETQIIAPAANYAGVGSNTGYTGFSSSDLSGARYTLNGKYWNGSAWVASTNAYAEANSAATINTNIGFLPVSEPTILRVILPSTNNTSTNAPSVDTSTITFTGEIYPTTEQKISLLASILSDALYAFSETGTLPSATSKRFTLKISGVEKYWNGFGWVTANGTYAQTNTLDEVQANITSVSIPLGETISFVFWIKTDDGLVTPSLQTVTLSYDFRGEVPSDPYKCLVYGYVKDINGNALSGTTVKVEMKSLSVYDSRLQVERSSYSVDTDAEGYWEMSLIANEIRPNDESYNAAVQYIFSFTTDGKTVKQVKTIPAVASKNYAEL